jgi:hypothetical protein
MVEAEGIADTTTISLKGKGLEGPSKGKDVCVGRWNYIES